MNTDLFCRYPDHEDQRLRFPVGAIIETVSPVAHLGSAIPVGARGRITSHCDDGRAWILFDGCSDAGHTFHAPEHFIRVVELPGSEPPAPRAGERERVILNSDLVVRPMPNTPLKTRYLLTTDDDWPVAEFYREEEAEGIAYEHNQHATLVAQRERLLEALNLARKMFDYIAELSRIEQAQVQAQQGTRMVSDFLAEVSATIEREGV